MISEKVELLGASCYQGNIPKELTITSMPTSTELEYVGSDDFDATMLDKILPACIQEKINCRELLEIDYWWLCRCLRILNYGPYFTTNAIYCDKCYQTSRGQYQVNLYSVDCKTLPDRFKNDIVISPEEFIDFDKPIHLKLLTIQEALNCKKDQAFKLADGSSNLELAKICYSITQVGNDTDITPVQCKILIEDTLSPADYIILKNVVADLTDYGLRAGGATTCPKCGHSSASFIALVDDRFFRPTLGDLRKWKLDRAERKANNVQ